MIKMIHLKVYLSTPLSKRMRNQRNTPKNSKNFDNIIVVNNCEEEGFLLI